MGILILYYSRFVIPWRIRCRHTCWKIIRIIMYLLRIISFAFEIFCIFMYFFPLIIFMQEPVSGFARNWRICNSPVVRDLASGRRCVFQCCLIIRGYISKIWQMQSEICNFSWIISFAFEIFCIFMYFFHLISHFHARAGKWFCKELENSQFSQFFEILHQVGDAYILLSD